MTCHDCGQLATCPICEACEHHCNVGGSGACAAASWNQDNAREAMAELVQESRRRTCFVCGGLEADDDPHVACPKQLSRGGRET
jgi:hypothetical protein